MENWNSANSFIFYGKGGEVAATGWKTRSYRYQEYLDGRTISAPLIWFPRLANATQEQLKNWELLGDGDGIHWPDVDEDLSVIGLLAGIH